MYSSAVFAVDFATLQRNYPINTKNPAHQGVKEGFEKRKTFGLECLAILDEMTLPRVKGDPQVTLLRVIGKGKGKGKGKKTNRTRENPRARSRPKCTAEQRTLFNEFRKTYPGVKRGLATELAVFRKHDDWPKVLPRLAKAIETEKGRRATKKAAGAFVPPWPHFQTYLNQRRWEAAEEPDEESEAGDGYRVNAEGELTGAPEPVMPSDSLLERMGVKA
jgi:hypothetical protein